MTDVPSGIAVDVHKLRPGMYVVRPDRPWVELPFLFQGFRIDSDEEIRVFREYCKTVYVDPERSSHEPPSPGKPSGAPTDREKPSPAAESTATSARKPPQGRKRPRPPEALDDPQRRYPDVEKFAREIEVASKTRNDARSYLDDVFSNASKGMGINVSGARSTIADLMARVTENPTASLWLTTLNDRDDFTTSHSINTCVLVLMFCVRTRLDSRKLEAIGMGSLLHDVGKSILPRELLNRAGPLTDHEWERMKQHPRVGYGMLGDAGNVSRGSLDIVRMHHERFDGNGYPAGLMGSDLPNYILLPALANRYQAMISPRPYRPAMAPDRVLQEFYNDADSWYGHKVVRAFMRGVGIYPVGSLVELDNGALAVIVSSRPNTRVRPAVQLVRTPDGEPYDKLVLINLAAEEERQQSGREHAPARMIRRVRTPAETGIDPGAVIAQSFGIQAR